MTQFKPKDYKCVENRPMFTFMPHIMTKFTRYMIGTFFS